MSVNVPPVTLKAAMVPFRVTAPLVVIAFETAPVAVSPAPPFMVAPLA